MTGPRSETVQFEAPSNWRGWTTSAPYPSGGPAQTWPSGISYKNQLIETSGHPFRQLGKSPRNIGGDFYAIKRDYSETENSSRDVKYVNGTRAYFGRIKAYTGFVDSSTFPVVTKSSDVFLNALGTKAIALTIPTNPLSGFATFMGELRQGLPQLVGLPTLRSRTLNAKNAGSEYLNVEFGWKPLVNDLKKFNWVGKNAFALTKQYEANSGKRLKRRVDFPLEESVSVTTRSGAGSYAFPGMPTNLASAFYGGTVVRYNTVTTVTRRWFVGCYTYYLPPYKPGGNNFARNEQISNYLFGTRITPDVLWNLTPWSWAADWIGNIGDIATNVSAFAADGLVMPYGYIMEEKSVTSNFTLRQTFQNNGNLRKFFKAEEDFSQTFTTISKCRRVATPYGFGLSLGSFSNRQWSILTALGLSRGGNRTAL